MAVAVHLLVCGLLLSAGLINTGPLHFLGLVLLALAGFLVLALCVSMEWNLTLARPDMALVQMLWAATVVIVFSQLATELNWLVTLAGFALILVGTGRLNRSEFLIFLCYSSAALGGAVGYSGPLAGPMPVVSAITVLVILASAGVLYRLEAAVADRRLSDAEQEIADTRVHVRQLATYDECTGVYNRRTLYKILGFFKASADRYGRTFSVSLVRLDNLCQFNDEFGTDFDDRVLAESAHQLQIGLREVDRVGRLTDNVFVLVLPDTARADAYTIAVRIADRLAQVRVSPTQSADGVSATFGITQYKTGEAVQETIERAAAAMCESRRVWYARQSRSQCD